MPADFSTTQPGTLMRARRIASQQAMLEVLPPDGFLSAHVKAGQFCKMRAGDEEGIFAMYSSPNETRVRFLVRTDPQPDVGDAADALAALPDGAAIDMTRPAGAGFDLSRALGRPVRFVATGTGVAPVRAAIEMVLRQPSAYGELSLDLGLRDEKHMAVEHEIERWREAGVHVAVHYSRPDTEPTGPRVQVALRERQTSLAGIAVIAVGQEEMLADLRALIVELNGDPGLLLLNI